MGSHIVTCHPTQVNIPRLNRQGWFTRPQTVTHPSTNQAQGRLTTLIEAPALTTKTPPSTATWLPRESITDHSKTLMTEQNREYG